MNVKIALRMTNWIQQTLIISLLIASEKSLGAVAIRGVKQLFQEV
jgi:hypothetical protein